MQLKDYSIYQPWVDNNTQTGSDKRKERELWQHGGTKSTPAKKTEVINPVETVEPLNAESLFNAPVVPRSITKIEVKLKWWGSVHKSRGDPQERSLFH